MDTPNINAKFNSHPFPYHHEGEMVVLEMDLNGQGLGEYQGWKIQVPFVLPGETIRFRIYKNHADYSQADLVAVLDPSQDRIQPSCALFGECGGCQFQHLAYRGQLAWKQQQITQLFPGREIKGIYPSPKIYGYRSKITPHFKTPQKGEIGRIGFLKVGYRSRLVDVEKCPIATEAINLALPELRSSVLALADEYKRGATLLLRDSEQGVFTDPNAIIREKIGDLEFSFPAGEFFQNNPFILPDFVRHACNEAKSFDVPNLIDAYCGSGLFGLSASRDFQKVFSIEISEKSLKWARENAKGNRLENLTFHVGEAERLFDGLPCPGAETVVLIDPPRKGCSEEFVHLLMGYAPSGIIYVSCNPQTQARDVALMEAGGYRIRKIQPFDLFPHTRHIENIVTMDRG